MNHKNVLALLAVAAIGLAGCDSAGSVDGLPRSARYVTEDLLLIETALQTTGVYHDEFGLEVHARNVRRLSERTLFLQSDQDGAPVFIRHKSPYEVGAEQQREGSASDSLISLPNMLASGVNARDALVSLPFRGQWGWLDVHAFHVQSDGGGTCDEIEFNTCKDYWGKKP